MVASATSSELLVGRRIMLSNNAPACPQCGEKHQMQLVDWLGDPAQWRCRRCRFEFLHEPIRKKTEL